MGTREPTGLDSGAEHSGIMPSNRLVFLLGAVSVIKYLGWSEELPKTDKASAARARSAGVFHGNEL